MNKHKRKQDGLIIAERALIILTIGLFIIAMIFEITERAKPTEYITYTVRSGDTLWSIARETYGDEVDIRDMIDEIERANSIEGGRIYVGQALQIEVQ